MRALATRPFVRVRRGLGVWVQVALLVIGMPAFLIAQADRAQARPTPVIDVAVVTAAPASPGVTTETGVAALASPRGAGTSTTSLAAFSLAADASTGRGASLASLPDPAASSSLPSVTVFVAAEAGGELAGPLSRAEFNGLQKSLDPNKLNHIFGKAEHGLDPLVQRLGSQEAVLEQMYRGLEAAVPASGRFTVTRLIGGQSVVIDGAVVDGVPRIGTAYIRP